MKIGAVIVTYNPENNLDNLIIHLLKWQLEQIVVIDNASKLKIEKKILNKEILNKIKLIRNDKNEGIGKALNKGIELLKKLECQWVLTFDQDSIPQENMLNEFLKIIKTNKKGDIKSIGPIYKNINKDYKKEYYKRNAVITSGNMIDVNTWEKIGKFKEEWFIDWIDTEYGLRVKKNGYRTIQITKAILNHNLGYQDNINLYIFKICYRNHSSLRKYYIARNSIYILKEYINIYPIYIIKMISIAWIFLLRNILLGNNKLENCKCLIKGILDGIKYKKMT